MKANLARVDQHQQSVLSTWARRGIVRRVFEISPDLIPSEARWPIGWEVGEWGTENRSYITEDGAAIYGTSLPTRADPFRLLGLVIAYAPG